MGEGWTANQAFLEQAIWQGDRFVLATPPSAANAWSYYGSELTLLKNIGYSVDAATESLVIP
jgi:hypothetical protein